MLTFLINSKFIKIIIKNLFEIKKYIYDYRYMSHD